MPLGLEGWGLVDKPAGAVKPPSALGKARRWVRRRIIVDQALQFRMLVPVVVFTVLFAFLAGAFVLFPLYRGAALDPNAVARILLREQLFSFQLRFWPILVLAGLISGIYALVRSNRIAGPLFKLKRGLMQMTVGEYQKIRFRDGDELVEFESVVNSLAQRIDEISSSSSRKLSAVERRLRFLKSRVEVRDLAKKELLDELDDLLNQVGQVQIVQSDADKPGD
jgi:hypothetical protein